MKVSEAIKILESKVLRSEENLKHFPKESQGYAANEVRIIAYNIAINKMEQIDEPQVEKVEVTEEQAELLRAFKGESIYELLTNCLVEDEELMAKAKLFGYTVKSKRWVVKYKPTHHSSGEWYFIGFVGGDATLKPNCASHVDCKTVIKFTDRSKAEAVAVLVEGSVEEV